MAYNTQRLNKSLAETLEDSAKTIINILGGNNKHDTLFYPKRDIPPDESLDIKYADDKYKRFKEIAKSEYAYARNLQLTRRSCFPEDCLKKTKAKKDAYELIFRNKSLLKAKPETIKSAFEALKKIYTDQSGNTDLPKVLNIINRDPGVLTSEKVEVIFNSLAKEKGKDQAINICTQKPTIFYDARIQSEYKIGM